MGRFLENGRWGELERESDGWMAGMPCPLLNSPLLDPSARACLRMKTSCGLSRPGGAGASERRHGDGE